MSTTVRCFVQTEVMKVGLSLTSHESSGRVHCDKTASSSDDYYQWIANAVEACSDQMMHDMLCAVFSEIEIRRFFAVRRLPRDAQSMHEMKRLVVQGLQNVWSRKQKHAFMHLLLKCTNTGFFEHLGMFEATKVCIDDHSQEAIPGKTKHGEKSPSLKIRRVRDMLSQCVHLPHQTCYHCRTSPGVWTTSVAWYKCLTMKVAACLWAS